MGRHQTFGQKIALGFAAVVLLTVVVGAISVYALRTVVEDKDRVIDVNGPLLVNAQRLLVAREQKGSALRAYLLTGDAKYVDDIGKARAAMASIQDELSKHVVTGDGKALLARIESTELAHQRALDGILESKRNGAPLERLVEVFETTLGPHRAALDEAVQAFVRQEQRLLDDAEAAASREASSAIMLLIAMLVTSALLATAIATLLTRALSNQIGTAVGQVQSASAELQAAANQQAAGAREQATAMNEITTTISELLATSKQISESSQRVSTVAEQTATAARSGDGTVSNADESISGIRRQVDLVVNHMLDLGKKSQQIGSVLDIVSELAEQTNILAINATIEAAGAGESGKRFAVVADEIRKLADRVSGSTKEIRNLIDDVRSAVNTTVMATETGSKAVDAGGRQFSEVTSAFRQIGDLVSTTSEAAREIHLSTKQQTTAVEQVNLAIANVAQASRETEASSTQTLQTASQLATLSGVLLRLVKA